MELSTSAKVGIVTLIGLIAISVVIIWKTEIFRFGEGYPLLASFEDIEGLTLGSEVRYRGLRVGRVTRIDPGPTDIKIYAVIQPHLIIPADSHLRVAFDGIVGLKYLEIRPGTSEVRYQPPQLLYGVKTAGVVDFIDIGSQNLMETKAIMETIRKFVEDPRIQAAFSGAIFTIDKTASEIEKLTGELRAATQGVMKITTDPKFQENVKETVGATAQTLTSANRFFEGFGKMNVRTHGGAQLGTTANAVRGNIDIIQSERNYFSIGMGEGPTRQPGLLDLLFVTKATEKFGYRLGIINNQLGGGLALYPYQNQKVTLRGDVYDINNTSATGSRLWPKLRIGYEYQAQDYMDFILQGVDLLN